MLLLRVIAVFFQINGTILLPSSLGGYSWSFLLQSEGLTNFPGCTKAVIRTNRRKGRGRYVQDGQNTSNMVYKVIKPGKLCFRFLKAAFKSYLCHVSSVIQFWMLLKDTMDCLLFHGLQMVCA